MVGGSGEKKTLRLVAKYADACNLFCGPLTGQKLAVLREHCEREGRDYDTLADLEDVARYLAESLEDLAEVAGVSLTAVGVGPAPLPAAASARARTDGVPAS